jgi:hypothetical protein
MTKEELITLLTDTSINEEPDIDEPNNILRVRRHIRHYREGNALTMLPKARLENIAQLVGEIVWNQIPGDFIETGVWRGGAVIFMRWLLDYHQEPDRNVWVADSFMGFPVTTNEIDKKTVNSPIADMYFVSLEQVKAAFNRFGLLDSQVVFLPGYFNNTLPTAPIDKLSLLRIDADLYDSTKDCLTYLYPKLSSGGYVIIDDYGESEFECRRAVNEYRQQNGITTPFTLVDSKCVYWRKE